jgi:adenine-specific DNA-methyltransferase
MPPLAPVSGTVYTPAPLAEAMVHAIPGSTAASWLDPCVGEGAFLRALAATGVEKESITAIDLSQDLAPDDNLANTIRGIDFFKWRRNERSRFDRIIANPPYVPLGRLSESLQSSVLKVKTPDGEPIRLGANYWCAFLCASLDLLTPGGDLCFVLPAAWDYANYASPLRYLLPTRFSRFEVYRCRRPMFGTVLDGCIVIVGRGFGGTGGHSVRGEYDTPEELITAVRASSAIHIKSGAVMRPDFLNTVRAPWRPLRDVATIRLGGVTGDAKYFLLTDADRLAKRLPISSVRPALTRASHLAGAEVTPTLWEQLRAQGERVWLFDPPRRIVDGGPVKTYLALSAADGGCHRERFKVATRTPWYRTPLPSRVDGFISGMSKLGPWICLRAMPRIVATNTLYTVRFLNARTRDEKAAWALGLLTTRARKDLARCGRSYAEGLLKYEPGDLLGIELPIPMRAKGAAARYSAAVSALLSGDVSKAQLLADAWFNQSPETSEMLRVKGRKFG